MKSEITKRDWFLSAMLFVGALALYARTLAPSVAFLFDDTLDFQYSVTRLGIPHQTGYPLYTLLGKLFSVVVPLNDAAYRLNLFTALCGALAIAMLYLVVRQLTAYRIAAFVAALTFAVSKTFWENAVVAEIYTLQMLLTTLVLFLALRHASRTPALADGARVTHHALYALAFVMGLGLAHHRLIALTYPAIALYVWLSDRAILHDRKILIRAAIVFLAPLLLYLYLPLRGNIGSADGTYENTLGGFFNWVMASQYTVFLTSNPLNIERNLADYWTLFQNEFGIVALALAVLGAVWLLRRPREWGLIVVALIPITLFAFNYHVADVSVFFLTTFLLCAIFIGAGADALLNVFSIFDFRFSIFVQAGAILLVLFIPLNLVLNNFATNDLSAKWDVHDYGLDVLSQPLEANATIIGIVGETTLVRYLQENRGIRPDVQTIPADDERARLAAVERALKENRAVYLTRPLKDVANAYSLSSRGALVRVQPGSTQTLTPQQWLDADFSAVKLIGFDLDTTRFAAIPDHWHAENGRVARVTLYWQVTDSIARDAMVSVKIVRADRRVVGQVDHRPVNGAYPTTAWRVGEIITDTYDVPLFLGVTPGAYAVNVTMYDASSNAVLGQRDIAPLQPTADTSTPRRELWNIAHIADADFGALTLAGYSLDTEHAPLRPGDVLPLTLLWRSGANPVPDSLAARLWLEDANGKTVASRETAISVGYPPFDWQPNSFVRDWSSARVPANVADGKYVVQFALSRKNESLGSSLFPFVPTVVRLGTVQIKNRVRATIAPRISQPVEVLFNQKARLLGFDLALDEQRNMRLMLHWRALALMDTSYTVFVHVLDAQGTVIASGDAEPGNGEFPTTGWIENEYIADVHTFNIPDAALAGTYQIEVGLYDTTTGTRLKTVDGQNRVILTTVNLPLR
ncbi:MAG: DUF2723 domain-containing protein [Chloroflexi bacterium]|nr:DUF2723 domain-containing protein [Chloroflexota bacterium]